MFSKPISMCGSVCKLTVLEVVLYVPLGLDDLNGSVLPAGIVNEKMVISNCIWQETDGTLKWMLEKLY